MPLEGVHGQCASGTLISPVNGKMGHVYSLRSSGRQGTDRDRAVDAPEVLPILALAYLHQPTCKYNLELQRS